MPVITCVLIEGYSEQTKRLLEERLTDAARSTTGAPWDGITVMINELPGENYMRGRVGRIPAIAPPQPADLVRQFLAAMEARDLDAADARIAPALFEKVDGVFCGEDRHLIMCGHEAEVRGISFEGKVKISRGNNSYPQRIKILLDPIETYYGTAFTEYEIIEATILRLHPHDKFQKKLSLL